MSEQILIGSTGLRCSPPFAIGDTVVAKRDYNGSSHNCILKGGHYRVADCIWSERYKRWTIELAEKYDKCCPDDFDRVGR